MERKRAFLPSFLPWNKNPCDLKEEVGRSVSGELDRHEIQSETGCPLTMKSGKLGSSGNEISFSKEVCHRSRGILGECRTIFAISARADYKNFRRLTARLALIWRERKKERKYVAESKEDKRIEEEKERERDKETKVRRGFRVVTLLIHIVRLLRACRAGHLKVDNYLGRCLQSSILKEIDRNLILRFKTLREIEILEI